MTTLLAELGTRGIWAAALVLGLPAVLLALNELGFALARAGRPIPAPGRSPRTGVVPALTLVLSVRHVLGLPGTDLWVG